MPQNSTIAVAESALLSSAVVLCSEQATADDLNVIQLLDFFAIPWKRVTASYGSHNNKAEHGYVLISSSESIADALEQGQDALNALLVSMKNAGSIYVYGFQANRRSTNVLRFLTENPQASLTSIRTTGTFMNVTAGAPQFCGPMSGMRVSVTKESRGCAACVGPNVPGFQSIIRADEGEVFFAATCAGVPVFVNMWGSTVDISASCNRYFDVKQYFCEAVPAVMYLRWAFRGSTGNSNETSACLIVDDPPLKHRYGFLDFGEALQLMQRNNFTTTIAFIPWNWRRTNRATLSIFRNHPERLSVVVHGCDHTAGEFAERSNAVLNLKIRTARHRMQSFRRTALIKTDRIMVFPQGEFSPEAGRALKLNGFVAAVNTEVAPAKAAANETTISDLWQLAIMKYGTFPIFTRRYPDQGIENFAFDGLLGKPCLITAHHEVFKDRGRDLVELVRRLNSLNWNLVWRPLSDAIRRTSMIQRLEDGTSRVQMFASSLVLVNPSPERCTMLINKEEDDPERVRAVLVNRRRAEFRFESGCLTLKLTLAPGESVTVRVIYRSEPERVQQRDSSIYRIRVAAKRYLSEFRDNYISQSEFLYQIANRLKRLVSL